MHGGNRYWPQRQHHLRGTLTVNTGDPTMTLTGGTIPANSFCTVKFGLNPPVGGSSYDKLHAGALQTSNGNNVTQAAATLTIKTK